MYINSLTIRELNQFLARTKADISYMDGEKRAYLQRRINGFKYDIELASYYQDKTEVLNLVDKLGNIYWLMGKLSAAIEAYERQFFRAKERLEELVAEENKEILRDIFKEEAAE